MFWCKTISGNDFTPHCVFGCAWKIKFSGKSFQLTLCFMALTRKLVYTFIFTTNHFRVSDVQRESKRERERKKRELPIHPKLIAPQHRRCQHRIPVPPYISHHHRDRITTEDRSTQTDCTQTNPSNITSPQTNRITTEDQSTQNRSHQCRRLDLVTHDP